jgi:hypothetical protein
MGRRVNEDVRAKARARDIADALESMHSQF